LLGYRGKIAWDLKWLGWPILYTRWGTDFSNFFHFFRFSVFSRFSDFPFFPFSVYRGPVKSYTRLTGLLRPTNLDWANQAYHTHDWDWLFPVFPVFPLFPFFLIFPFFRI
jgi:hypothetical protein